MRCRNGAFLFGLTHCFSLQQNTHFSGCRVLAVLSHEVCHHRFTTALQSKGPLRERKQFILRSRWISLLCAPPCCSLRANGMAAVFSHPHPFLDKRRVLSHDTI